MGKLVLAFNDCSTHMPRTSPFLRKKAAESSEKHAQPTLNTRETHGAAMLFWTQKYRLPSRPLCRSLLKWVVSPGIDKAELDGKCVSFAFFSEVLFTSQKIQG